MKILCLNRYGRMGASSRLRFYQYVPYLQAHGIEVKAAPLLNDDYITALYAGRRRHLGLLFANYLRRVSYLLKVHRFDVLWIEKELLPWVPAWGEVALAFLEVPYIVDYDDAIFHHYDLHRSRFVRCLLGRKIDAVMRHANLVTVGNDYLVNRARWAGAARVEYLPTVIDLDRYCATSPTENTVFTIGWIGTPITSRYLGLVQPALEELCKKGNSRLVLVGSGKIALNGVALEIRSWSEEAENADIQCFDVGIMPLPDDPWERGKCGYKLIQYMASCKPAIASPVGVNQQIIDNGVNGFLASTQSEWIHALETLRANKSLRESLGKAGRKEVEARYSLQVMAPRLVSLLRSLVKEGN